MKEKNGKKQENKTDKMPSRHKSFVCILSVICIRMHLDLRLLSGADPGFPVGRGRQPPTRPLGKNVCKSEIVRGGKFYVCQCGSATIAISNFMSCDDCRFRCKEGRGGAFQLNSPHSNARDLPRN